MYPWLLFQSAPKPRLQQLMVNPPKATVSGAACCPFIRPRPCFGTHHIDGLNKCYSELVETAKLMTVKYQLHSIVTYWCLNVVSLRIYAIKELSLTWKLVMPTTFILTWTPPMVIKFLVCWTFIDEQNKLSFLPVWFWITLHCFFGWESMK